MEMAWSGFTFMGVRDQVGYSVSGVAVGHALLGLEES